MSGVAVGTCDGGVAPGREGPVTRRVHAASAGGGLEDGEATVTGAVDGAGGDGVTSLTVRVALTAEQQSAATKHSQVGATLRTVPGAVEGSTDRLVQRPGVLAVTRETEVEPLTARDGDARQPTLAGVVDDRRVSRETVRLPAVETLNAAVGPDERPLTATVADG